MTISRKERRSGGERGMQKKFEENAKDAEREKRENQEVNVTLQVPL